MKISDVSRSQVGFSARTPRSSTYTAKNGDVYASNAHIPKGDFARFLGYEKASAIEKKQGSRISGPRALELAIQDEFQKLGKKAIERGAEYRNMYSAQSRRANMPGQEKAMLQDGIDAIHESLEVGQTANMHYLEMQYKFQMGSMSYSTLSNLMKTKHDSVKNSLDKIR